MDVLEKETQPPNPYTDATLLAAMKNAGREIEDDNLAEAMKQTGLGTPATRAAIIEGLIKDKYILRQNKELVPSAKAAELVETIATMKIEELMSPEMTGQWEYRLEQIARGKQARLDFMKDIRVLTRSIVNKVKSFDEDDVHNMKALFVHEATGQTIFETLSYYESQDKSIRIRKFMGGRFITNEEINRLLKEKTLGPLTGFISKAGKPFTAVLKLNEQNKVRFVFDDVMEAPPDFSKMPVIGTSPLDGSNVYEGELSYFSETVYKKGCKTGLKINKIILGQPIKSDDIVLMLEGKLTKLIKGFQSAKTKIRFDAYLTLPKSGKISFSFPTRTGKKMRKKPEKVANS
jgi:DNA topoisomerase-3